MKKEIVELFCGPIPENYSPVNTEDNSYVFLNDPNFDSLNLFDFFGRVVTVNSFEECAHYVSGGWEPFKVTIFDIITPIIFVLAVVVLVIISIRFNIIYKIKKLIDANNLFLKAFKQNVLENKKIQIFSLISLFLAQHFFLFSYVKAKAVSIPPFIDEYVSLTSNVNFFKALDFNAGILGGSYNVYLTSGPVSAVGGVISWILTNNFYIARISNFYWIFILQFFFSLLLYKEHKHNLANKLMFNGIFIVLIPWWLGSLYSIGEIASMIIFGNAIFLYEKNKKLSMAMFAISIFYGKLLTLLPFIGFYGTKILVNRDIRKSLHEMSYFLIPTSLWFLLIQINYSSGDLLDYFIDQYNFIINHPGSGIDSIDSKYSNTISYILTQTEVRNWSTYDIYRISLIPILQCLLIIKNRVKIDAQFKNISYPLIFSILLPFIWFWVFNSNKWIRYSQHFSIIVLITLFYLIFSNIEFGKFDYFVMTAMLSLFIDNSKYLILILIACSFFVLVMYDQNISFKIVQMLFILIVTIDIAVPYFTNSNSIDLYNNIQECEASLIGIQCQDAYFRDLKK